MMAKTEDDSPSDAPGLDDLDPYTKAAMAALQNRNAQRAEENKNKKAEENKNKHAAMKKCAAASKGADKKTAMTKMSSCWGCNLRGDEASSSSCSNETSSNGR